MGTYQLPTKLSEPKKSMLDYIWLIYGREKSGKTDLLAQFPNAYFMMCEPGGKALRIYQSEIRDWYDFRGYVKELTSKKHPYRMIVIDTVDIAYDYCLTYVCKNAGIKHPSDQEYGKGWKAVKEEFLHVVLPLSKIPGVGLAFVSHSKTNDIERRDGSKNTIIGPTMPGQASGIVEGLVDVWAYVDVRRHGERYLMIRGDDQVLAGHKLKENFLGGVTEIHMGKDSVEAYQNLLAAFENRSVSTVRKKLFVRR